MRVQMELLEDMIFGNGQSIPGEEDISILYDEQGFPYYKGGSFKGVFREELERYLDWTETNDKDEILDSLLGKSGSDSVSDGRKLIFSDFTVSDHVKEMVIAEEKDPKVILDSFTSLRTFTRIDENGMVADGSLRIARCVNRGIRLYGEITCDQSDEDLVKRVLSLIKWLGTLRNRGFGKVRIEEVIA